MNLSLRNRVSASFSISLLVVIILSVLVFQFLNSLNKDLERIMDESNRLSLISDDIRITTVSILKQQRRILLSKNQVDQETINRIIDLSDSLLSQLQTLDAAFNDPKAKNIITSMISYSNSLKIVLSKATFLRDPAGIDTMNELSDKILESLSEFQDIQYFRNAERDRQIRSVVKETKKNMMITLIIGFLAAMILFLVVPGKIALPFKKINDALRELQDCNFDVNIYYNQDDEIGEIAREMNKMIASIKKFEELRSDRVNVEQKKFDVLANLVRKPVLVANANNKVIYMNSKLYEILQCQSEDIINKEMSETPLPPSIISAYELAIKRRSKIENAEIVISRRNRELEESDPHAEPVMEITYQGYANVIPIRGKESSLDYYIMVMSQEVFA